MNMDRNLIGIIGAGIMGEALIVAISKLGKSPLDICISDKLDDRAAELRQRYGCQVMTPSDIVSQARNVLLVVKPQDIDSLLDGIGKSISTAQRVISFA